ncbi:hypothetical protein DEI81_15065 [Curtobacterium sp. MCBD17_013]|uniref:hypothetical protein n=1 Tax=Curtobacterium sp. MCBD17_013 TaxID=2175668 RepID=UPI000DA81DA9|nr:hypothetical protein [Curtobacterium sp. MCBD17_013]PZF58058.1 hypothetical protein DEI81_15065 [Curtobacterium sp. MCBD17_013]
MPRVLCSIALAAGLVTGLAGCSVHDSTGRVSVDVSTDAAQGHRYNVQVLDADGQLVEHQSMLPGQSSDFAGVPLGRITVRASGLCTLRTTLHVDEVVHVRLGTGDCHR